MSKQPRIIARVFGVAAGVALVGLFIAGARKRSDEPSAADSASAPAIGLQKMPAAAADVAALLDGLRVGDDVAGWKVQAIDAPQNGAVLVFVRRDNGQFAVGIVAKGKSKAPPPLSSDSYDLWYGHVQGTPPPDALPAVAQALLDRIRKTEKSVPLPAGM